MNELVLKGCSPTPLASYLKALAILRLVTEQRDPDAKGWWRGEHFVLRSGLDEDALQRFFLEEYRPTPIIAPWNGGSGFYFREEKIKDPITGKNIKNGIRNQPTSATKAIDTLLDDTTDKFDIFRKCICISKKILMEMKLEESPKDRETKFELLSRLRGGLPESGLAALDATISLSNEGLLFPPLLGTGGTDGNLDFTSNFIQRLLELFSIVASGSSQHSSSLLRDALFNDLTSGFTDDAIGMFSPGQSGGSNASTGFEANANMNPWDFVLMIEGTLLFSSATTRRFENDTGALSFPFTVRPSGAGTGTTMLNDERENTRAETWIPIWEKPASIVELNNLLSEGRITLGRRQARDGLDFARAVSQLAVNRGIQAFERYAFFKRSGKNYFATPIGRFIVPKRAVSDLISELENNYWLSRFQSYARRDEVPARTKTLAHRLDNSLFELTQKSADRMPQVQSVLTVLGQIHRYCATSPAWRDKLKPIPRLSEKWVVEADDGDADFRLAAALAGLYCGDKKHPMPLRTHIAPESEDSFSWSNDGRILGAWSDAELTQNLAVVMQNRLLRSEQWGLNDKPLSGAFGCDLNTLTAFLVGDLDDRRISVLVTGLSLCRIPGNAVMGWGENDDLMPPAAFGLLKVLFSPNTQLRRIKLIGNNDSLSASLRVLRLLEAGRTQQALQQAHRRLQIAGFSNVPLPTITGIKHTRLAASLLIPLSDSALKKIARMLHLENAESGA